MALRSVVLTPPPGAPRRTVVLRPGGPQDKGKGADLVTGAVGLLLLLSCILLVRVLPHKEYALPQFKLSFPDTVDDTTFPTQEFAFRETEQAHVHEFTYDLPDDVPSFTVLVAFTDDVGASLPDQFRVEVFDAQHNAVGTKTDLVNDAPKANTTNPLGIPQGYDAVLLEQRITVSVAPHPAEQVVPGLSHLEVKEQALARLEPQYRLHSAGTWTVRVTLVNAGDCPEATAPEFDATQAAFCRSQSNTGADPGNAFKVERLIFTTYKPAVEQLS